MPKPLFSIAVSLITAVLAARPLLASSNDIPPNWTARVITPQRIILPPSPLLPVSSGRSRAATDKLPRPWRHTHAADLSPDCRQPTNARPEDKANWKLYKYGCDKGDLLDRTSRYKISRGLGSGLVGHVWEAQDLYAIDQKDALVAIKCSYHIWLTLLEMDHLRDVSSTHHANIARYIDSFGFVQLRDPYDANSGRPVACIVQELIHGRTLQDALFDMVKRDPVNTKVSGSFVRRMFRQILLALKHMHGMGMVHRDIKADNFMLETGTERLVLIDFGFAAYDPDARNSKGLPSDVIHYYPSGWYQKQNYMPGFDPELNRPAVDISKSSESAPLQHDTDQFAFDRFAAGTVLRGLFTAEVTRIVGWRELLQGDKLKAMNQWAKELFGENTQAWELYRATRQPSATRITLDGMLQHPFMTQGASSTLSGRPTGDAPFEHPRPVQQMGIPMTGLYTGGSLHHADSSNWQRLAAGYLSPNTGSGGPYFTGPRYKLSLGDAPPQNPHFLEYKE